MNTIMHVSRFNSKLPQIIKAAVSMRSLILVLFGWFCIHGVHAQNVKDYLAVPPLSTTNSDPMIMLTLATDHQLYFRAYADFDKPLGQAYDYQTEYAGYFDNKRCYLYQNNRFEPQSTLISASACAGTLWSGNFLNWVSMTRIDVVRSVLYGGFRSTDEPASGSNPGVTVLERSYLPNDAHSFAKYYGPNNPIAIGNLIDTTGLGAQDSACNGSAGEPARCQGYTFCNTTVHAKDPSIFSSDVDTENHPPLIRVVKGNFSFWSASERYQCLFGNATLDEWVKSRNAGNANISDAEAANLNTSTEIQYFATSEPIGGNGVAALAGVNAFNNSPTRKNQGRDYIARVLVCDSSYAIGAHADVCKPYVKKNVGGADTITYKPTGILQEHGESGDVRFGLITGGFANNIEDGVLRKNVSFITDEIDLENGTFHDIPPADGGIISSLNALRIEGYRYFADTALFGGGTALTYEYVDENTGARSTRTKGGVGINRRKGSYVDRCNEGDFGNGTCRDWGNPFGEMMLQSYLYFAGVPNNPSWAVTEALEDSPLSNLGLTVAPWRDPTVDNSVTPAETLSCANMNVLAINGSGTSFDSDMANDVMPVRTTAGNVQSMPMSTLIERIDDASRENIPAPNTKYFAGEGSDAGENALDGGLCTAKTLTSLGDIDGVCFLDPNLQGSFFIAGAAHAAHTEGVRAGNDIEDSTITTYGVSLTDNNPIATFNIGGDSLEIIPACRNLEGGVTKSCALVDFKLISLAGTQNAPTEKVYAVSWEDSQQGNDYDSDINGTITITRAGGGVNIRSQVFGISSGQRMDFGYVINGAASIADGYVPAGEIQVNGGHCELNANNVAVGPCTKTVSGVTLATTTSSNRALKSPLYYAAKWGGYKADGYFDESEVPADYEPDKTYTEVQDPSKLKAALNDLVYSIIGKTKTGSASSPATNSLAGDGLVTQALYMPEISLPAVPGDLDGPRNTITWAGVLNGLMVDNKGQIRQDDGAIPRKLDPTDSVVKFLPANDRDKILRFEQFATANDIPDETNSDIKTINELQPVWSAVTELSKLQNPEVQRVYSNRVTATSGRHIFTAYDTDDDGIVRNSDVVDFVASRTGANYTAEAENIFEMLDWVGRTQDDMADLINYIRGQELAGYRSRTIDWNQDGTADVYRLGDIANSTPAVVGRPSENYGVVYGDSIYEQFRRNHLNRRQMVYVGANDGMLHAFNAGFYDLETQTYNETDPSGQSPAHPLGSELWAYVPYNALPHLKWLADENYKHVYYVDSSVQKFDVNIFDSKPGVTDEDSLYHGGWGTIIVVGMRYGGGEGDSTTGTAYETQTGRITRSAYMIFDVTDPSQKPELLAEFTSEDLGYTMGKLDVVTFRTQDSNGQFSETPGDPNSRNDWYLVVGSGPNGTTTNTINGVPESVEAKQTGISVDAANLFYLKLNDLDRTTVDVQPVQVTDSSIEKRFVGGLQAADWDSDFRDDALYFGTVGDGKPAASSVGTNYGALRQAELSETGGLIDPPNNLLEISAGREVQGQFSTQPKFSRDIFGNRWVFAGSGRFLSPADLKLPDYQNAFYGLKAPDDFSSILLSDLFVASDYDLFVNSGDRVSTREGRVFEKTAGNNAGNPLEVSVPGETNPRDLSDIKSLREFMLENDHFSGWYSNYVSLGENQAVNPTLFGDSIASVTFDPNALSCDAGGNSYFYIYDTVTGLPQYKLLRLRTSGSDTIDGQSFSKADGRSDAIPGFMSEAALVGNNLIINTDSGQQERVDVELIYDDAERRSWREIPLEYVD